MLWGCTRGRPSVLFGGAAGADQSLFWGERGCDGPDTAEQSLEKGSQDFVDQRMLLWSLGPLEGWAVLRGCVLPGQGWAMWENSDHGSCGHEQRLARFSINGSNFELLAGLVEPSWGRWGSLELRGCPDVPSAPGPWVRCRRQRR